MQTERLIFRNVILNDLEDIYEFCSDKEVSKYVSWEPHKNLLETEEVINNLFLPNKYVFSIVEKKSKKCIGIFELRPEIKNNAVKFGYVLNRDFWNKGYMSETLKFMIEYAFNILKVNRVYSMHIKENIASGRVMEKCGLKKEGEFEEAEFLKGRYITIIYRAILRKNYKKGD